MACFQQAEWNSIYHLTYCMPPAAPPGEGEQGVMELYWLRKGIQFILFLNEACSFLAFQAPLRHPSLPTLSLRQNLKVKWAASFGHSGLPTDSEDLAFLLSSVYSPSVPT